MKRIFALILSFALLLSCLVLPAGAMFDPSPVYQVQAQSAYIVNTDTNIIVYEKDSTKQVSAGGLTKYMTIALVLTNYADQLDNTFQMPFAISDYVHNTSNADMRSNETFTYREALYAMVTRNANEAAMGLAYTLSGGDLDGWVSQMNALSQRIGTTNSTWTDACGIDSGNVTCAVDMYLILRYLMSFDAFVEISGVPTFTMPASVGAGQPECSPEQKQRRQLLPQRHAGRHVRRDRLQEGQRKPELRFLGQSGRCHLYLLCDAKPRHLRHLRLRQPPPGPV